MFQYIVSNNVSDYMKFDIFHNNYFHSLSAIDITEPFVITGPEIVA